MEGKAKGNNILNKLYRWSFLLVIGVSLVFYGILTTVIDDKSEVVLTEQEIKAKAKALGMVELNEAFSKVLEIKKEQESEKENDENETSEAGETNPNKGTEDVNDSKAK